jgi:branched-subunit amino acid permease
MKNLLATSLPALLLTYPLVIILYARSLNKLVTLSKSTGNTIFGHLYINLSQIISDMTFTKDLWRGKKIQYTENKKLKKSLIKARLQLIFTAYFGLFILLIFLSNEIINTH